MVGEIVSKIWYGFAQAGTDLANMNLLPGRGGLWPGIETTLQRGNDLQPASIPTDADAGGEIKLTGLSTTLCETLL